MPERGCKAYKIIIMKKQFKRALSALVLFVACLSSGYAQENAFISPTSDASEQSVSQSEVLLFWDLQYTADPDYIDQGMYGFGINRLENKRIGISFSAKANYGLIDSDYASSLVKIGPNYSYALSDKLWLYVPLCANLIISNYPSYNKYGNEELEMDVNWGLDLTPSLALKFGEFIFSVGMQLSWTKGVSEIGTAGTIGIGLKF